MFSLLAPTRLREKLFVETTCEHRGRISLEIQRSQIAAQSRRTF